MASRFIFFACLIFLAVITQVFCGEISKTYEGPCIFSDKCDSICRDEGHVSGHCSFLSCWCDNMRLPTETTST